MKLRNKKTGEIRNCELMYNGYIMINSLKDLEEWEDYEEFPKGYWVIEPYGKVEYIKVDKHWSKDLYRQFKDFGNCFETREEAEKVVECLRAWKRLKDKGFKLSAVVDEFFCLDIYMKGEPYEEIKEDLKIVFGGEE